MEVTEKKIFRLSGGSALLFGGGWLADKTSSYAWEGLLNLFTAGMGDVVTWDTFPWRNAVGVISIIGGILVLIWPLLRRISGRISLNEGRVTELIGNSLAALPPPDESRLTELTSRIERAEVSATERQNTVTEALTKMIQDHQISLGHALDERFAEFAKMVSPVEIIQSRLRHEYLESLLGQLNELEDRHSTDFLKHTSMTDTVAKDIDYISSDLVSKGLSQNAIRSEFDSIEAKINSDTAYDEIEPDEKELFSGIPLEAIPKKRRWHIRKQKIEFLKRVVEDQYKRLGNPSGNFTNLEVFNDQ